MQNGIMIVVFISRKISRQFDGFAGILHCPADSGHFKHGDVIAAITKRHQIISRQLPLSKHLLQCLGLINTRNR